MSLIPLEKRKPTNQFNQTKTLLYGINKIGKTTFCSQIPDAMFAGFEDGFRYLETAVTMIKDWETFLKLCSELCTTKHPYKMLVIDIADIAYNECEKYICKREGVKLTSDVPYGGGYKMVRDEFLRVLNKLNLEVGMGIVLTSHSKVREIKKKNEVYTMMDTSLSPSASDAICGFVDHIFYAYIDEQGNRVMRSKPTKYINAGDRSGRLPEIMPFDYKEFERVYLGKSHESK